MASRVYPQKQGPVKSWFTLERVLRVLFIVGIVVAVIWLVQFFSELALFLFIGFVLAYVLTPLVDWFQQVGLARIPAVLVTFLLVLGLFSFVLASLVPFMVDQTTDLTNMVTGERLAAVAASLQAVLAQYIPLADGVVEDALENTFTALFEQESITGTVTYMVDVFTNILYAVIIVPFTTFFFMKDGHAFRESVLHTVPNRYLEITLDLIEKVESNIGAYLRAIVLRGLVVSIISWVLLSFVGLQNALVVGVFTGVANTIPYFGPVIGFAAGGIVGIAQTGDFSLVLGIFLVMAVIQILDNVVLQPYYFSRAADAHPLFVLCAVLVGARLAGILGMLIAIPVLTIIRVTVRQIMWSLRNYHIFRTA